MIVDCNTLFGFWPRRRLKSDMESVRAEAASHGITKLLVCSFRGIFDDHTDGNDETIEVCQSYPDLEPVATLNPHRWLGLEKEIDRLLAQDVKVFRFFPEYQHWPYRFMPFYRTLEMLEGSGAMVICPARVGGHQNNGVMTDIAELAGEYDLSFLITGVYYGNLAEAIAVAQSQENIFLETHLLNSPDGFEVLVEEVGAERLMYGSQSPLHHINSSLLPLMNASIKDDDRERILHGNISRQLRWNQCE
jgi:predicted TIM-barrel fold metal-dependent hydrolase